MLCLRLPHGLVSFPDLEDVVKSRVYIVTANDGDWEGVYVDGILIDQDHSCFHGPHLDTLLVALTHQTGPSDGDRPS